MNRDNLRKVEVLDDMNQVKYTAYFHQFYKDVQWNGASRPYAILELENGEVQMISLSSIRFIS